MRHASGHKLQRFRLELPFYLFPILCQRSVQACRDENTQQGQLFLIKVGHRSEPKQIYFIPPTKFNKYSLLKFVSVCFIIEKMFKVWERRPPYARFFC